MNRSNIASSLSDTILMWLFLLVCIGVAVASLILWYHWMRYNMRDSRVSFAQIIYFLGLFILLAITLSILL